MSEDYDLVEVGEANAPIPFAIIQAMQRLKNGENEHILIDSTGRIFFKVPKGKKLDNEIRLQWLMPRDIWKGKHYRQR